ncbi:MAG TPA: hypothetical protein VHX88_12670 [Solirubrobacteraceae bacterium]|jgi:hypothetical protein|nr:hypothetical protein [Solirubrobacteraceae bacterium]
MGLLDDAIREHLELKRLRGADPDEVARLEREALGPVRRGAEASGLVASPPRGDDEDDARSALDDLEPAIPAPADDPEPPHGDPFVDHHLGLDDDEPPAAKSPGPATSEWSVDDAPDSEAAAAPVDDLDPPTASLPVQPSPPLAGHDEDEADDDAPEDVLEETPEFLQETPEHDRLWFEQRPPRDFDFDK